MGTTDPIAPFFWFPKPNVHRDRSVRIWPIFAYEIRGRPKAAARMPLQKQG